MLGGSEPTHNLTPSHGGGPNSQANPGMTTFSGGFTRNPLSRRGAGPGGVLNQTADTDPRGMRCTGYSKQDVREARDGLKLLKNRMEGTTKRKTASNSQSAARDTDNHVRPYGGLPQNQSMNFATGGPDRPHNNRRS